MWLASLFAVWSLSSWVNFAGVMATANLRPLVLGHGRHPHARAALQGLVDTWMRIPVVSVYGVYVHACRRCQFERGLFSILYLLTNNWSSKVFGCDSKSSNANTPKSFHKKNPKSIYQ